MSRSLFLLPLLFLAPYIAPANGDGQPPAADAPAAPPKGYHQVKLNGHTFTIPDGFTIELAAGADLAPRPIAAAFDEKGRLYVTDSSGSNEKVAIQVEKKPHRVVRLEDTNGDGKFDKQSVYVPNIMFPEGCMYLSGSVYVAAPPHIWKFTDTDDDGKADKEEIWFDGKTLTGCANDLHGPYLGPDGWIYWCKGAFAEQTYTLPSGKKFTTKASHIFRARPDGTGIEPVMTGGMDNPVDLVFTPGGDIIFSCTFLQRPADGKRDGLIHAVYGAVYGKDHAPVYDHPWTHPTLMPPMTHLGPAAPCGLHRYESDQFGKDYENNLFCCQFNMRKVSRHVLVPTGSTYSTKDSDFVVSDSLDFHPTDVIEDADGSLLIVDTGGWYKLCCPTSQLVKPDVTGGIYRVRKVGSHKVEDPRGLKIAWDKLDVAALGRLLNDPRPAVRQRVVSAAEANRVPDFDVAVAALASGPTERGAVSAVWRTAQWEDAGYLRLAGALTLDPHEEVRLAAMHVLGLWGPNDESQWHYVVRGLKDKSLRARRVAAEAFARMAGARPHAAVKNVPVILRALADETNDRAIDHALTYALIEIGNAGLTAKGLTDESPRVRRACLAALSYMAGVKLEPKSVLAELDAKDAALRDTAWWIAGRHPEWGGQLAGYFAEQLKRADKLTAEDRNELADRLVKFAANADIQKAIAAALQDAPKSGKQLALRVIARSGSKAMPDAWKSALMAAAKTMDDRELVQDALEAFRRVPVRAAEFEQFVDSLPRASLWPAGVVPDDYRLAILSARPPATPIDKPVSDYLVSKIGRDGPPEQRAAAVEALTRAAMTHEELVSLTAALGSVSPLDLARLLPVFEKSKDQKVGLALVSALSDPKVRPAIRTEQVKPILDKYPKPVRDAAEKLYALLAEARKDETAKLERLVKELPAGDIRRGQLVFNGTKAQCAACHKIGYKGGLVGPDLTRIGNIRTERDLLESIVFPSASFVRSYEPVRVVTLDGRTFSGILKSDAPDEIVLTIAADKEERIPRADVESMSPSSVSVMPAGLDQQLSPQELADLVAFLKANK